MKQLEDAMQQHVDWCSARVDLEMIMLRKWEASSAVLRGRADYGPVFEVSI
jgi:hypothetical protein